MNDQVTPEGGAMPSDANASQPETRTDVTAEATGSGAESSPAADTSDKPAKAKSGEQIRIDELTRRLRESERRYDRLFQSYETATTRRGPDTDPQPTRAALKTLKDFNFDEAAWAEHERKRLASDAVQAAKNELADEQAKAKAAERVRTFKAREREFAKTVENYSEVAHFAPISEVVADMVMELEDGPQVAFYLGTNTELAEQLNALPERQAAFELGRLEQRLKFEREKLKAKPVSQAPPPPPKIEAVDPGDVDGDTPNDSWSDARFAKWRERQIAQRR